MKTLTFLNRLFGASVVATAMIVAAALTFTSCGDTDDGDPTPSATTKTVMLDDFVEGDIVKWEAPSGANYLDKYFIAKSKTVNDEEVVYVDAPKNAYYKLVKIQKPDNAAAAAVTTPGASVTYYTAVSSVEETKALAAEKVYKIENLTAGTTSYHSGAAAAEVGTANAVTKVTYLGTAGGTSTVAAVGGGVTYYTTTSTVGGTGALIAANVYEIVADLAGAPNTKTYHTGAAAAEVTVGAGKIAKVTHLGAVDNTVAAGVSAEGAVTYYTATTSGGAASAAVAADKVYEIVYDLADAPNTKVYTIAAAGVTVGTGKIAKVTYLGDKSTSAAGVGSPYTETFYLAAQSSAFANDKVYEVELVTAATGASVKSINVGVTGESTTLDLAAPASGTFAKVTYLGDIALTLASGKYYKTGTIATTAGKLYAVVLDASAPTVSFVAGSAGFTVGAGKVGTAYELGDIGETEDEGVAIPLAAAKFYKF